MRCEAAVSPTISATPFSPTVSATPKILSATPEFEEFETIVYTLKVGNIFHFYDLFNLYINFPIATPTLTSATPNQCFNMIFLKCSIKYANPFSEHKDIAVYSLKKVL